ncbi:MAG: Gp15 family bacteriophage protein [Oscillospiraceae bacterium]|nr:Gp15 family bacteriophage protein [Oscillospiraceae bacterium]
MWNLPLTINIQGIDYAIRNKCDYRVVLDVIAALNDEDLETDNRIRCALFIFYEDLTGCKDLETAAKEMMKIINNGEEDTEQSEPEKPQIMD